MSFSLFPLLPAELRLKIWSSTLPGPRTITLHTTTNANHLTHIPTLTFSAPDLTNITLSSLWLTCTDSHDTVKKHYYPGFGGVLDTMDERIMFAPDFDTLYFSTPLSLKLFYENSRALPRPFTGSSLNTPPHSRRHHVQDLQLWLPMSPSRDNEDWVFDLGVYREALVAVLKSMVGLKRIIFFEREGKTGWEEQEEECIRDFRDVVKLVGSGVLNGVEVSCLRT